MAQKRAYVGAILNATGASEFYTQDVEDMNIGCAEVIEVKEEKNQTSAPVQTSSPQATEKPWFNKPQLDELATKPNFILSFNSSQELIDELLKTHQISYDTKGKIGELYAEKKLEKDKADCDLPF
jgi:hypothetical protein